MWRTIVCLAAGGMLWGYACASWASAQNSWFNPFPEFDGDVMTMATRHDTLYVGGYFVSAGDAPSFANLAQWRGGRWHGLGSGVDGIVRTLAIGEDGVLYAGGYFQRAGGRSANHVARWKNGRWMLLEAGTNSLVNALQVGTGGMLHVGGTFSEAGALPASRLACWNPATTAAGEGARSGRLVVRR